MAKPAHHDFGVFLPVANGGWIISSTTPPLAGLWKQNLAASVTADEAGLDFVMSMAKWRGFGGETNHWGTQMESLTMDREVMHLRDGLIPKYSTLVYNGFWFAPERLALQAFVTESQKNVTGTVRVRLYKGNILAAGRKSPVSLYRPEIATMEADPTQAYNQGDATGFIRLNALRLKVASKVAKSGAKKGGVKATPAKKVVAKKKK